MVGDSANRLAACSCVSDQGGLLAKAGFGCGLSCCAHGGCCCCWVGSRGEFDGVCQGSVSGSYSLAQSPGVPGLAVAVLGGVWCGYVLWVDCCGVEGGPWYACGCVVGGC